MEVNLSTHLIVGFCLFAMLIGVTTWSRGGGHIVVACSWLATGSLLAVWWMWQSYHKQRSDPAQLLLKCRLRNGFLFWWTMYGINFIILVASTPMTFQRVVLHCITGVMALLPVTTIALARQQLHNWVTKFVGKAMAKRTTSGYPIFNLISFCLLMIYMFDPPLSHMMKHQKVTCCAV